MPGARCTVAASAEPLARTLLRLHADRSLTIEVHVDPAHIVRCQREDLDEMLGNLLDNACKWARSRVVIASSLALPPDPPPPRQRRSAVALRAKAEDGSDERATGGRPEGSSGVGSHGAMSEAEARSGIAITVDDDGPGLDPSMREAVLQRGVRADEASPGSGLGLAIVRELAGLYGGSIELDAAPMGGLRATLRLPGAAL
jgi:signal transduction histidine kinase